MPSSIQCSYSRSYGGAVSSMRPNLSVTLRSLRLIPPSIPQTDSDQLASPLTFSDDQGLATHCPLGPKALPPPQYRSGET